MGGDLIEGRPVDAELVHVRRDRVGQEPARHHGPRRLERERALAVADIEQHAARPGDVLRRVDAVPVADTRALLQRLPHWRATGALTLELERQGRALALPVRLSL